MDNPSIPPPLRAPLSASYFLIKCHWFGVVYRRRLPHPVRPSVRVWAWPALAKALKIYTLIKHLDNVSVYD